MQSIFYHKMKCHKCKWIGDVCDCGTMHHEDGKLDCPECHSSVDDAFEVDAKIKNEIINEFSILINKTQHNVDLLAIIGSYQDTMPDEEVLSLLKHYNEKGTIWKKVYAEVDNKRISKKDTRGALYVDCSECTRGGNGSNQDACPIGWKIKKGNKGGCFYGQLIQGLEL